MADNHDSRMPWQHTRDVLQDTLRRLESSFSTSAAPSPRPSCSHSTTDSQSTSSYKEHANLFGSHSSMVGKRKKGKDIVSAANKRLKTTLWSIILCLRFTDQTKAMEKMQLAQVEMEDFVVSTDLVLYRHLFCCACAFPCNHFYLLSDLAAVIIIIIISLQLVQCIDDGSASSSITATHQ